MYRVVAVTDLLTERAASCAAELGARQLNSFELLIADEDIELVVVASYNLYHADQAEAALRAGKHVICETPFGLTTADVDRMTSAAAVAGKVVQAPSAAPRPVLQFNGELEEAIRNRRPQSITPETVRRRVSVMQRVRERHSQTR